MDYTVITHWPLSRLIIIILHRILHKGKGVVYWEDSVSDLEYSS